MLFDVSFDSFCENLPMVPRFSSFTLDDINPHSGQRKIRQIYNPNKGMRIVHARLIRFIRSLRIPQPNAMGAHPGSSPIKNIVKHRRINGSRLYFPQFFFLTDISGAYQSVDTDKLVSILADAAKIQNTNGKERLKKFLEQYCISKEEKGLIVGAPASPDLFNLYCEKIVDEPLRKLCEKYCLTYTRYLDDLTFSSSWVIGKRKRREILKVIRQAGFAISEKKTQVFNLAKQHAVINGITISHDARLFLPQHVLSSLRGKLHQAFCGRISMNVIAGHMGALVAISRKRSVTATEAKILEAYAVLKKIHFQNQKRVKA